MTDTPPTNTPATNTPANDSFTPEDAAEALADAWASMDGKLDAFRAGKAATSIQEEPGGHYSGYLYEARELMQRLERRGYSLAKSGA